MPTTPRQCLRGVGELGGGWQTTLIEIMRHVSSACPAIARLGAAIAKGALKDFINLHEDEPFAAELISRQYVRKLTEEGSRSCGTLQGAHTESHDK